MASGWMDSIADLWVGRWRMRGRAPLAPASGGLAPITVITGASSGIGLSLARRFAAAGDNVMDR